MLRAVFRWLIRGVLAALLVFIALLVAYRWIDPPGTPLMVIRWLEGERLQRSVVPLARMSAMLTRAVIASEDNRFCSHAGVDLEAVKDAIDETEETGRQRGASTITMQLARNLFLWPGGRFFRKALEIPIALAIEAAWPKRRIIELYLNIAEWGPGVFGAEAAATHHFQHSAQELTRGEAVRLAIVLPSPRRWNPARPTPFIQGRARTIDRRIDQLGASAYACALG